LGENAHLHQGKKVPVPFFLVAVQRLRLFRVTVLLPDLREFFADFLGRPDLSLERVGRTEVHRADDGLPAEANLVPADSPTISDPNGIIPGKIWPARDPVRILPMLCGNYP
jgi:hypothetical protein